jgi:catechol 2,3-dioxygenase-like lactoylglutathione lyase family enzyme
MSPPLNAFCLMPAENGPHMAFMTGVLGLRPKRSEESFVSFDTAGVVVCLWESGHVCRHLGWRENKVAHPAATARLTLRLPGPEALATALAAARAQGLSPLVQADGVLLRDRAATWWHLVEGPADGGTTIPAVTFLAEDAVASSDFLHGIGFARTATGFQAGNGVALAVQARAAFAPEAALHRQAADGPVAMPAIGCRTLAEVSAHTARLEAAGLTVGVPGRMHEWGFQAAYLSDPSHNLWEIYATERTDV